MEIEFEKIMEHIVSSIQSAGYEPYDQLCSYLKTGDETYITRTGDARRLVKELDRERLQKHVNAMNGMRDLFTVLFQAQAMRPRIGYFKLKQIVLDYRQRMSVSEWTGMKVLAKSGLDSYIQQKDWL